MTAQEAVATFNFMARGDFSEGFLMGKGLPHRIEFRTVNADLWLDRDMEEWRKIAEFLREIAAGLDNKTRQVD